MRYTFGTQVMYLVDLAQDCLEMRFDGFTERRKPDRRRSNKGRPSSCSNRRIAVESDGWEMPLIAAARVNVPTLHKSRKYLICRRISAELFGQFAFFGMR
jgi:hypothetical protein